MPADQVVNRLVHEPTPGRERIEAGIDQDVVEINFGVAMMFQSAVLRGPAPSPTQCLAMVGGCGRHFDRSDSCGSRSPGCSRLENMVADEIGDDVRALALQGRSSRGSAAPRSGLSFIIINWPVCIRGFNRRLGLSSEI
jgi:hypothetical protein